MIYETIHETRFEYSSPVSVSHQVLRLKPRATPAQTLHSWSFKAQPTPVSQEMAVDFFGNEVLDISIEGRHRELTVTAKSVVEVLAGEEVMFDLSPPFEEAVEALRECSSDDSLAASQFCYESPFVPIDGAGREYVLASFPKGQPLLSGALDLTRRIYRDFKYRGGVTDVYTPVREVLRKREGVCQDFSHVQLACLREIGLAARYVSGYLRTYPPEGEEELIGSAASHAWLSVWCPQYGWVDFDPTNNMVPSDEHITVAWGRDYGDVSPVNGFIVGGGSHKVLVSVSVTPVEADRVVDQSAGR
ncbi:MAG: transglutaminase family protein [Proteobacteria bacterium]|jgi:transglutaminase-like putative cysteine protease|nr:transglutaminase family protein [Pseudomonadota bacterium]MDA1301561.1 transglutaminase family protein [Pseudomonadota bacterium]